MSAFLNANALLVSDPNSGASTPSLPTGYLTGLELQRTGQSRIEVAAGKARDESDAKDLELAAATEIVLNNVQVGSEANGRDQAADFQDVVITTWLIGDSTQVNPVATLASTSVATPTLPAGYDLQRFLGQVPIGGTANDQLPWNQSGSGRTRKVELGPPIDPSDTYVVGTPGAVNGGAIGNVSESTSWRNVVAAGTDVNFDPATRFPQRPVGQGGLGNPHGPRVLIRVYTDDEGDEYVELSDSRGLLEVPSSTPSNGDGIRVYIDPTTTHVWNIELQLGEGNSFMYRSSSLGLNYAFEIRGWWDDL